MADKTTEQTIADILKRLEAVEQKQQASQPSSLQSPSEAEQERFQAALESFNRDNMGRSLNSIMPPAETEALLKKLDKDKNKA